jgi:hypothetical protein
MVPQENLQEGCFFPVEFTVQSLLKVIDSMEAKNSGGAGKAIPFYNMVWWLPEDKWDIT